ncbi:MAG: response regulator [Bacteroidetes bacterium]|nr:response regulator [Bacteroidota bacterium]HET6245183.1 response regulator [Bacteroidia bacterium]
MNDNELINIFIIEDNRLFMLTLKAHIEIAFVNQKMKIYCFETGEACMDKFKEVKPQIAILDYHLNSITPDAANGIKILDWIKKEHKETFVIMLTDQAEKLGGMNKNHFFAKNILRAKR